jgi:hypothetical protein
MRATIPWTEVHLKKLLSDNGLAALRRAGGGNIGRTSVPVWPDEGRLVREDFHLEFSNALPSVFSTGDRPSTSPSEPPRRGLGWNVPECSPRPAIEWAIGHPPHERGAVGGERAQSAIPVIFRPG